MTFQVIHQPNAGGAQSPFHVIETQTGREVEWVNRFLDRECVRCLANTSLRSYAMDLLHFLRWWTSVNHTDAITENAVASVLPDYVQFQAGQQPRPAPATINRRVIVVGCALRHMFPDTTCSPASGFSHSYWLRSSLGYGRFLPVRSQFRVREPKRIPVPLSVDQVSQFWSDFRTARDMAIVGLMLLQGLRSKEVIALDCEDVQLAESRICVHGKGNKVRPLPLASDTVRLLDHYLRLERPAACGSALFVSLKGRARGTRITPAGLRSLFRYHRLISGVPGAHPHRFRHTFASDMVRAGISLPALMNLMGHASISTTMIYVQISPRDVIEQYARAVAKRLLPIPSVKS
ncbi:MAG TPA: tyrosine-type recombinase/integrase [Candidatus Sulfotelmatobacter sp.]